MSTLRVFIAAYSRSSLGHLVRCAAIGAELLRRGHAVLLGCADESIEIARRFGIDCSPIHELPPLEPWPSILAIDALTDVTKERLANPRYLERALADEKALLERFHPDVVLSDARYTACVAARQCGLPSVSLCNLSLLSFPLPSILPLISEGLRSMGMRWVEPAHLLGDHVAVPDTPEAMDKTSLDEWSTSIADRLHYLGPVLRRYPIEMPSKDDLRIRLDRGRAAPMVFVCYGGSRSVGAYLAATLRALRGLHADLVVVTGPNVHIDAVDAELNALRTSGARSVRVEQYTDQVLEYMKAAHAAIIHGGHGMLMEGLACATPLVVVPHNPEQAANAERCLKLGVGRIVDAHTIADSLPDALSAVLSDIAMVESCRCVARALEERRGTTMAADLLEKIVFKGERQNLRR